MVPAELWRCDANVQYRAVPKYVTPDALHRRPLSSMRQASQSSASPSTPARRKCSSASDFFNATSHSLQAHSPNKITLRRFAGTWWTSRNQHLARQSVADQGSNLVKWKGAPAQAKEMAATPKRSVKHAAMLCCHTRTRTPGHSLPRLLTAASAAGSRSQRSRQRSIQQAAATAVLAHTQQHTRRTRSW